MHTRQAEGLKQQVDTSRSSGNAAQRNLHGATALLHFENLQLSRPEMIGEGEE